MRFLGLFLISVSFAFGCALCSLYTPTTHVSMAFSVSDNTINEISITWEFSEEFTQQTLQNYDANDNETFDPPELETVKGVLLDYLVGKNYVTELSHYTGTEHNTRIPLHVKHDNLTIQAKKLFYAYSVPASVPLHPGLVIKGEFHDAGGFFDFRIAPQSPYKITPSLWVSVNINNFVGYYKFDTSPTHYAYAPSPEKVTPERSSYLAFLETKLLAYTDQLKALLKEATQRPSFGTLFPLVLVAFLYGFFHAAGPGHGKTLVGSYYVAQGGRWQEALWLSLRIGVVHVLGAFLLVLVSFYGIQTFVSKLLSDVTLYTTRLSATFIILIAFWMLATRLVKRDHKHACGCQACRPKSGWGIVLAAGMVPCPGTVVIFILTFTLGSYTAGILGALSMALGMSTVIFTAALLGQSINTSSRWKGLSVILEWAAIVLLLGLGILMLLASF